MNQIFDKRLVFITGKGGVGKTTITAALGYLAASYGKKVLLCELESRGNLASAFSLDKIGYAPQKIIDNLYVMSMDTAQSLAEYVHLTLKLPNFGRLGPLNSIFELFSVAAPGVREILSVGKLCYEIHENHYDLVIADASATGHVIGMLTSSKDITDMVDTGVIHDQTGWMDDILYDPNQTCISLVTTAHETPVLETLDLADRLLGSLNIGLGPIFANMVMGEIFNRREADFFAALSTPYMTEVLLKEVNENAKSSAADKKYIARQLAEVLFVSDLAMGIRREEEAQLLRLASGLSALKAGMNQTSSLPDILYLPYLFNRSDLFSVTKEIAANLSDELSVGM